MYRLLGRSLISLSLLGPAVSLPPAGAQSTTVIAPPIVEPMPEVQPSPVWRHYGRPRYDNQPLDRSYAPQPENPHKFNAIPLAQLNFVGALTTSPLPVALIRAPTGAMQRLRIGQRVGQEQAQITAISAEQLTLATAPNAPPTLIALTPTPENQGECHYNAIAVRGQLSHTQARNVIEPNFPALCQLWRFLQTERPSLADKWELSLNITSQGQVFKPMVRIPQLTPSPDNVRSLLSSEWRQLLRTWQFPPFPQEQQLFFTLHFSPKLADASPSTIVK